jgi:60 kDa SS-A/Ro ribonucleoprotein
VDDWTRARRFLILGCEGGTFSTKEQPLAVENAAAIGRLLAGKEGAKLVAEIVSISTEGRAAKQGPTIFAFAMCARLGDVSTRRAVYASLQHVCRIPTHLFMFIGMVEAMGAGTGWGRLQRKAIAAFYNEKKPAALAMAVTKYKNREGWTHLDVLRLAHVKPGSQGTAAVLKYAVKGTTETPVETADADTVAALRLLRAVEEAKTAEVPRLCELIATCRLAREHIPSTLLNEVAVWEALLVDIPPTALLRSLGKLSKLGVLASGSPHAATVAARLSDPAVLGRARVHPFSILLAKATYDTGKGVKGDLEWPVNPTISDALGAGFEAAFGVVKPTGKRILQAVDISGSMAWSPVMGSEVISARVGAAALAYTTQKAEPRCTTVGFGAGVVPLPELTAAPSLAAATQAISQLPDGPLDLVMLLDCTGSMGSWISEAKSKLIAITEQLGAWFAGQEDGLRVGFVAYRDIGDAGQHVVVEPTSDYQAVLRVVEEQHASGGGDAPEDIAGAFHKVGQLKWRADATKLVVHICDAPCHGKQYHTGHHDNYPTGDPMGRTPEHQLQGFAARGIDYVLFDVAHGRSELEKMTALFKTAYDETLGRKSLQMGVSHLGDDSDRLEKTVLESVERSAYGAGTDCAAPILWAAAQSPPLEIDTFVVYTDSETAPRGVSAADALQQYRRVTGIDAKLAVVAMTASEDSVADPADAGMLDMVGFDASGPNVLRSFVEGRL